MLVKPLPAYVSYVQRGHLKMDAIEKDLGETVTVRTSDGKTIKGEPLQIYTGTQAKVEGNVLHNTPFDGACYGPVSASAATFEGRSVEAIALKPTCTTNKDDENFQTLYVDPQTHDPIAVTGEKTEDAIYFRIEERFARTGEYVLPSFIMARIKGSGLLFWLDLDFHVAFTDYTFSETAP
jgi:hypothetical protein